MSEDSAAGSLPDKTCSIDRLIRQPRLVAAAKAGIKTQQRRNGVYAYPGESFHLDGVKLNLTDLKRQNLSEMTEDDAHAEGYTSLDDYRCLILKMHPGMQWDESGSVWVHYFELG